MENFIMQAKQSHTTTSNENGHRCQQSSRHPSTESHNLFQLLDVVFQLLADLKKILHFLHNFTMHILTNFVLSFKANKTHR